MPNDTVISTLSQHLQQQPGINALFLGGSHGTGLADAYSDLDFVLVAEDGATDAIASHWKDAVAATGEIILWWDRNLRPLLINAITADWTRIDVMILKPDQLGGQRQDALKVLFDPEGLFDGLQKQSQTAPPSKAHALYQFQEFIRILGLLPLSVGRKEYINGVMGVFHLRNLLVDLMIAETGAAHRGGALHLNRLITPEQKAVLEAMPPPVPDKEKMIAGHLAYAADYLPRARRLAQDWGVDWPERFEHVTWGMLFDKLALKRPY